MHGDHVAHVTIGGASGRELAVFVDGRQLASTVVSDGATSFWIVSRSHLTDAAIFFRYLDGAQEETDVLTGAEWDVLLNPG